MRRIAISVAALVCGVLVITGSIGADSEANESAESGKITVDEARRQARVLHEAMHSSLHAVHHHFYREDEGLPIPAETLKDVFAHIKAEQKVKLRWLAVEGQVMNTDHSPQGDFEIAAVKALKAGKREYEAIEEGVYRRAGAITLTNHCLKCHVPNRKSTEDRTAGLVISIPLGAKPVR